MSGVSTPTQGRRRLALVSYHFPPEEKAGGRRPFQLRSYLPEFGWDVRVLCPRLPDGRPRQDPACLEVRRGRVGEWLRTFVRADERPLFEQWSGASTEGHDRPSDPVKARVLRAARGLLLPDEQAPWIGFALRAALADPQIREADAVLATAPPYSTHVVGFLLARKLGVPLVMLEAMASGLKVVLAELPMTRDWHVPGISWTFPIGDEDGCARSFEAALQEPVLPISDEGSGRAMVLRRGSLEVTLDGFERVCSELVAGPAVDAPQSESH